MNYTFIYYHNSSAIVPFSISANPSKGSDTPFSTFAGRGQVFIGYSLPLTVGSYNALLRNASPGQSRPLRYDRSYPPRSFVFLASPRALYESTNRTARLPAWFSLFPHFTCFIPGTRNSRYWESRRRNGCMSLCYLEILEITTDARDHEQFLPR